MDKKLRTFLRKEMKKINTRSIKNKNTFIYAFTQAKFDLLMDIDQKFQLGAFYKKGKS